MNDASLPDLSFSRCLLAPFRRFVGLTLLLCLGATAQAGVYLSHYTFSSANVPYVYTNEGLDIPFKLRVKIIGVPGYGNGFHAAQAWNNNYYSLESLPPPGTYTVALYWLKYVSDWTTLLEVGPQTTTTITVQSPPAVNGVAWGAINLPTDGSGIGLPGQSITATASVTNNGSTTWNSNYYLELKDSNGTPLSYPSINGVSPGNSTTATFVLTLPATAGVYTYAFTALQNNVQYFGGTQYRSITVNRNPVTSSFTTSAATISGGQSVTLTGVVTDPDNNLTSQAIDYIAPGGGAWVSGSLAAGTRWEGGATGANTLTKSMVLSTVGTWQFRARGGDALGGLSNFVFRNVTVTAPTPITVSLSLDSASLAVGQSTGVHSTATPAGELVYHGLNGRAVGGVWQNWGVWNDAGGTQQNTTIGPLPSGAYELQAYAARADGVATTGVLLTLNVSGPPTISTQPASQSVNSGATVTFTVVAAGPAPLSYQWRKNGVNVGTNSSSYTLSNVQTIDAANGIGQGYSVIVTNSFGSATSNLATLTVATVQPIRLAVQYWQADDYPGITVDSYEDSWVEGNWIEGYPEDEWGWDEEWNWVVVGSHWVDGYQEEGHTASQWVGSTTYLNGQSDPSWTTTAGDFDIASAASGYSPATANRGFFQGAYNLGAYITFHAHAAAPSANCNNFTWTLFAPGNVPFVGGSFSTSSPHSFYANYGTGNYRIDVSYQNATSGTPVNATVSYYIPVGVSPPAAPVVTSPLTASGTAGMAFSYTITASNSPTSFAATGLPAGLSLNTATGVISGTPTLAGTSSVTLTASNAGGTSPAGTLGLTITAGAPVITSSLSASGTIGAAFTYTITATNSPTSYSATGLPAGLGLNVTTGAITGTPTAVGSFSVGLTATNAGGSSPSATLLLTISGGASGGAPVITTHPSGQLAAVGGLVAFRVTAAGTAPLMYQWRKNGVALSNGGAISGANSPTLIVAGISAADNGGAFDVVVTDTIGTATSVQASLTVQASGDNTLPQLKIHIPR